MSSRGETSNREGGEESSLMLQAMQQQFERMNVVFNDIRDRMDRQDAVIVRLCSSFGSSRTVNLSGILPCGVQILYLWFMIPL